MVIHSLGSLLSLLCRNQLIVSLTRLGGITGQTKIWIVAAQNKVF